MNHRALPRNVFCLTALLALLSAGLAAAAEPTPAANARPRGEVIFRENFNGTAPLQKWQGVNPQAMRLVSGQTNSTVWEVSLGTNGAAMMRRTLNLDGLRGAKIRCRAMVKADHVAEPPNPWNGIKVMLHIISPAGQRWEQRNGVFGTFDWKPVEFTALIPKDATSAELVLGLENTSGRAWFDDIELVVAAAAHAPLVRIQEGSPFKGHALPRLRGAMIGQQVDTNDLREFGREWGANHVRWQLIWNGFPHSPADKGDLPAYDRWLESELARLDRLLPVCREAGLLVLIDLHTPPGGRDEASNCRIFQEPRFQKKFFEVWEKIARRYRDQPVVWGYDLVNEPCEGTIGEGCLDWQALATATAKRVRAIDPEHAIVIEPAPWGGPEAIENLEPIPVPGVVYSVHFYLPHKFTHQGVYENPTGLVYPGIIDGQRWDKDRLRRAWQPVMDFQRATGTHIYIGEFSAIRWAPDGSAQRWLRDVIDLMEEQEWDWAYHAFREWDGWSVEHGPDKNDRKRSPTRTDREQLLRDWFSKNVKPAGATK